jgi:ERF superfamily
MIMNTDVTLAPDAPLTSLIERASRDPNFDVGKFEVLVRLQMEVSAKEAIRSFNRAMAEAQSEMQPVIRDAANAHLRAKYATLAAIDADMRPIYTRHGFSIRFGSAPSPRPGDMRVTITVAHRDGYFETNHLDCPTSLVGSQGGRTQMTSVQQVGAVVTYLRRYLQVMAFNIVLSDDVGDDDGEGLRRVARQEQERRASPGAAPIPPRPTVTQWLDRVEERLDEIDDPAALNLFLETREIVSAREALVGDARLRFRALIDEAVARLMPPAEVVPVSEADNAQA